jgi:hypothetical protein
LKYFQLFIFIKNFPLPFPKQQPGPGKSRKLPWAGKAWKPGPERLPAGSRVLNQAEKPVSCSGFL